MRGTAQTPADLGVSSPRSAKLRRLGRTLAASGAVPFTIQHKLVDRALEDFILENNDICEKS
ncbi:hypothetical protein FZD05_01530 [Rossellomorea aquimaris]|nr:hypothetical protein FZD05_01530 [Rossellomorea aquimaris]